LNHFGRIYTLHKILCQSRRPVPLCSLQEETGYSRATINRIIRELRLNLSAPLEYNREEKGYYYEKPVSTRTNFLACGSTPPKFTPCFRRSSYWRRFSPACSKDTSIRYANASKKYSNPNAQRPAK